MNKKSSFFPKYTAIISGLFTLIICGIMNLFLIPAIESNTNGLRCFDMNPGYNYNQAKDFLNLIGEEGKAIYLRYQLPLDFVYPLFYTLLFISLLVILTEKYKLFIVFPILLFAADYTENIFTEIMLRSEVLSPGIVRVASVITIVKTALMYFIFLLIALFLLKLIVEKLKSRKNN